MAKLEGNFYWAVGAMIVIVASSNYLVQFPVPVSPLDEYLTYGAFTYPIAFLVTDITNRVMGPYKARMVVMVGFFLAVLLSFLLATPRIALASGTAFLVAQFLDITVFNYFRQSSWWRAPLISSVLGSIVDTFLFFGIAFIGVLDIWFQLALGDLAFKLFVALLLLAPFRLVVGRKQPV